MRRVLLDEGVPRPLAQMLRDLKVDATAFPNAWKQLSNGKLLDAIESDGYDALLTNDKNIRYQQNLRGRQLAVLILPTNRLREVLANAARIAAAIKSADIGEVVAIPAFRSTD